MRWKPCGTGRVSISQVSRTQFLVLACHLLFEKKKNLSEVFQTRKKWFDPTGTNASLEEKEIKKLHPHLLFQNLFVKAQSTVFEPVK